MNLLRFSYKNWRGDVHVYVIDPELTMHPSYEERGADQQHRWCVSGAVVTRDGDPRPEMGENRRRTFLLTEMYFLGEVERSS